MPEPSIRIEKIDWHKFTSDGVFAAAEEPRYEQPVYIIENFSGEILDDTALVKSSSIKEHNPYYDVIICISDHTTTIKEIIRRHSHTKYFLNVTENFSLTHEIECDFWGSKKGVNYFTIVGGPKPNHIKGNHERNFIIGGGGDDILDGQDGDDVLEGCTGDDKLHGGPGNDGLAGYDGDDWLDGGPGNDLLYGQAGNDTYVFRKDEGVDRIIDTSGDNRLIFEDIDLISLTLTKRDDPKLNEHDLLIQTGPKSCVTAGRYFSYAEHFSFYNSTGQKYNLTAPVNGTYKFELASK